MKQHRLLNIGESINAGDKVFTLGKIYDWIPVDCEENTIVNKTHLPIMRELKVDYTTKIAWKMLLQYTDRLSNDGCNELGDELDSLTKEDNINLIKDWDKYWGDGEDMGRNDMLAVFIAAKLQEME